MIFRHLQWDSDFFGIKIGQLEISPDLDDTSLVRKQLDELKFQKYRLVYGIFDKALPELELKRFDAFYASKKVLFSWQNLGTLTRKDFTRTSGFRIAPYNSAIVSEQLYSLSLQSGLYSRFRLDNNLPKDSYKKLYRTWIEKSIDGELADITLVACRGQDDIKGMLTIKTSANMGQIGLLSVDKFSRGQNLGRKLIEAAQTHTSELGLKELTVATQANNIPAYKLYQKTGFHLAESKYIYHLWL